MNFQSANESDIPVADLDSLYPNALNADTSIYAVFRGQEQEFIRAYQEFLTKLSYFLKANDFEWGAPTRCFNKIYFNGKGEVDYFLFNFKPGTMSAAKQSEFAKLLEEFKKTHQFTLVPDEPFSQCSPVVYEDL
jgi:hypothetical protein